MAAGTQGHGISGVPDVAPIGCRTAYLVCSVQRSGTELLCTSLADTGVAGRPPGPLFDVGLLHDDSAASFRNAVDRSIVETMTSNGVSGQRMFWNGFAPFMHLARGGSSGRDVDVLRALFPDLRFVWLRREDKLRQAISFWRATAGPEQWRNPVDPSVPVNRPPFDLAAIAAFVELVSAQDSSWQRWFEANDVSPVVVTYDHLQRDRPDAVRHVLEGLGLDPAAAARVGAPRVVRQADAATDEYVARYLDGLRQVGHARPPCSSPRRGGR